MTALVRDSQFVSPRFIEELGCDGLSATDIAKSLDTEPKKVRQKLKGRNFLSRIESQGFKVTTVTLSNANNLEFDEYFLDVDAAKFFVGKYDSEIGDSYLAFLIRLERNVDELSILTEHDPILRYIKTNMMMRMEQLKQGKEIEYLKERADGVDEKLMDSILSVPQKQSLKGLIDSRARSMGDIRFCGKIQRDLKEQFGLNATNDKWYHIRQGDYEAARDFVSNWGSV